MTYQIAVLYEEATPQDAMETFEDVQAELDAWKIPYKAMNGKVKKIRTEEVEVAFLPYDKTAIEKADLVYTTERIRRLHKKESGTSETKMIGHDRPFQDLVNIVLEIKTRYEAAHPIAVLAGEQ